MTTRMLAPTALALLAFSAATTRASEPGEYARRAREVTEHIQKDFFDPGSGLYFRSATERKPDYVWLQGVVTWTRRKREGSACCAADSGTTVDIVCGPNIG